MHGSITARCRRLALASAAALALTIVPYRIALHGSVPGIDAAAAHAAKGGNGGGNSGNGGGNGGSNGGGNSGGGSNGNGNGNSGGNSGNGNGNSGGNSGNGNGNSGGNSGNGNGNSGGNSGNGNSGTDGGGASGSGASHVNAKTGDKVDVDGGKITVEHPDGMTEKIENGRFRMQDALGRMIIDRQATPADVSRLKAL